MEKYTHASTDAHVVAQLVAIVGPPREVLGERATERLDRALERPARGPGLAQDLDHQIANLVPVGVTDAGVFWAITVAETAVAIVAIVLFRRGRWKTQAV